MIRSSCVIVVLIVTASRSRMARGQISLKHGEIITRNYSHRNGSPEEGLNDAWRLMASGRQLGRYSPVARYRPSYSGFFSRGRGPRGNSGKSRPGGTSLTVLPSRVTGSFSPAPPWAPGESLPQNTRARGHTAANPSVERRNSARGALRHSDTTRPKARQPAEQPAAQAGKSRQNGLKARPAKLRLNCPG